MCIRDRAVLAQPQGLLSIHQQEAEHHLDAQKQRMEVPIAVSYTHLDVYKRQIQNYRRYRHTSGNGRKERTHAKNEQETAAGMAFFPAASESREYHLRPYHIQRPLPGPVSYTHLDVYKRQPSICFHIHQMDRRSAPFVLLHR